MTVTLECTITDDGCAVCGTQVKITMTDEFTAEYKYHVETEWGDFWFRYDDGWRFLPNGPTTTVDMEHLMADDDWSSANEEGAIPRGVRKMLDVLRTGTFS